MNKSLVALASGLLVLSTAAYAQNATPKTAAECETIWTTADANADGMLDSTEMTNSKSLLPMSMQSGQAGSTTTPGAADSTASSGPGSTGSGGNNTTGSGGSASTESGTGRGVPDTTASARRGGKNSPNS